MDNFSTAKEAYDKTVEKKNKLINEYIEVVENRIMEAIDEAIDLGRFHVEKLFEYAIPQEAVITALGLFDENDYYTEYEEFDAADMKYHRVVLDWSQAGEE